MKARTSANRPSAHSGLPTIKTAEEVSGLDTSDPAHSRHHTTTDGDQSNARQLEGVLAYSCFEIEGSSSCLAGQKSESSEQFDVDPSGASKHDCLEKSKTDTFI